MVVVRLVPLAVVNDNAPVLKLVEVVLPRFVKPDTFKLVVVTFVPKRLVNEMLVEVRLVPLAVPNARLVKNA